ncbi:MAG: sugar phosphate nucleotidyltransferase [Sulfuricaulis sp.]|nr:sugar phosphate nucleotidyltransferase [Sulfuricaulis sp.]
MKVVLFCGGQGMRLREFSDAIPKPMVNIGYRPILWHVMKYYAYYGHKDFILCLGHRGDVIKNYFLNYDECLSNDFVLTNGAKQVQLLQSDIHDWKISFVDTGLHSNIGQRLMAVRSHLEGEEMFLANYSDGLTAMPLTPYLDQFHNQRKIASFLCVKPAQSFHAVTVGQDGLVSEIQAVRDMDLWVNGGYFAFRKEIFDYMHPGEELVVEPFQRLVAKQQLLAYRYDGFFGCMDTFKEKQQLDDMYARGDTPWEVWKSATKA